MKFLVGAALALLVAAPVRAREWTVKMLNKGPDGAMMQFEPAFLRVAPGDTVKFVATDKGHNAESIPAMIPAGATPFKGRINEEIVVRFTTTGLYAYKCLPHTGMGMVGLIQVGGAANKAAVEAGTAKLPGLAKKVMTAQLAKAK